jgi:hypothetical protein
MMKKISLIFLIMLFFQNCGYNPIYSKNQNVDFYIESITFNDGDDDLAEHIKFNLNKYLNQKDGKKYKINTSIEYKKIETNKNTLGEAEEYDLSSNIIFKIEGDNLSEIIKIKESFKMDNFNDEFEEREYEQIVKKSMARSIVSKLLIQLSRLNVN